MTKLSFALIGACLVLQSQARAIDVPQRYSSIMIAPAGPKPKYDAGLCIEANQNSPSRQGKLQDEAAIRALVTGIPSDHAKRLLSLVGDDVMWWVRTSRSAGLLSLPTAFHEANHTLDFQLSDCNGNKAAYFFEGKTYVTDLVRGTVPPYAIAGEKIPAKFKSHPLGRYATYFLRTQPLPGNDFTTLLDELNAYVGAGQLEVKLATTPLYLELKEAKITGFDGNIGGVADFMLYTLCYLQAVREVNPQAYTRIKNRPLFMAHLQRLWSASERLLENASPFTTAKGGLFQLGPDTLEAVYSPAFIGELDKLSIRHKRSSVL